MRRTLAVYLPAALFGGAIVFVVVNVAAWYNLRDERNVCHRQGYTRSCILRPIAECVVEFQKEHGEYPASLDDIPDMSAFCHNPAGRPADDWDNPIQYSVSDNGFTLFSFGRDGKEGGIGLDAELYHDDRNHEETLATFSQFFFERNSSEVNAGSFFMVGLWAAGFTAYTIFRGLRDQERGGQQRLSRGQLLVSVLAVIVLACVVGVLLLPFYIPSGH